VAENLKLDTSAPGINVLGMDRLGLVATLDWHVVGTLALLVILGFGLRVTQLGAIGFAEDEMNKLDAIHAYERGDFSANSEHPMVMKLLMWASVDKVPAGSQEAALRLPNALIGALTVIPLFLLMLAFFDRWTALLAAAFWAFGINAITHNRIGKEDSLLVFFMLFAFFFFVIVGVFLLASPAVLMPEVWQYMNAYMGERLLTHSGYLFAGQLYKNNMSSSPFWGTPIYFYLLFLAIKVPIVTLIAFLTGLVIAVWRPRHLGHAFLLFMFLFWIVPYSLIGGKWLRYTLSVMPFVYMIAAVGVVGLIRWATVRHYLAVFDRPDLNSQVISSKEFDATAAPGTVYVIAQRGRTYFENRDELEAVRAKFRKVHEVNIGGASAVEVFINQ